MQTSPEMQKYASENTHHNSMKISHQLPLTEKMVSLTGRSWRNRASSRIDVGQGLQLVMKLYTLALDVFLLVKSIGNLANAVCTSSKISESRNQFHITVC